MSYVRNCLRGCVFLAALGPLSAPGTAQGRVDNDRYPFSIMTPESGKPRAAPRVRRDAEPTARPVREAAKRQPRRVRRGSSTLSTIPTYRSPLTPLGTAPTMGTVQPLGQPSSPSVQVPGIRSNTGVATTPPRPAGQSAQDRAVNCVHSGAAQGVSPGQIGAFTQSCVNR